jgi:hypothetical protein
VSTGPQRYLPINISNGIIHKGARLDSLQIVIQIKHVVRDLQSHYGWFSILLNPYIFLLIGLAFTGIFTTAIEGFIGSIWTRFHVISGIKLFRRSFIIKEDCPIFTLREHLENIISDLFYEDIVVKELASGEFMIRKLSFTTRQRTTTPLMCGILKVNLEQRDAVFTGILIPGTIVFLFLSAVLYFAPILFFYPREGIPFLYYLIPPGIGFMVYMIFRIQAQEFGKIIEKLSAAAADKK